MPQFAMPQFQMPELPWQKGPKREDKVVDELLELVEGSDAGANMSDAKRAEVQELVEASSTAEFGGIRTKVQGAREANEHGIPAIIAESTESNILEKIASAQPVGTLFLPVDGDTTETEDQ